MASSRRPLPAELSLPQVDLVEREATIPVVAERSSSAAEPSSSIHDALLDPDRIAALSLCDRGLTTYNPDSFLADGLRVRGRNLGLIAAPMILLFCWGVAWGILLDHFEPARALLLPLGDVFAPLLTTVSFLLVFRLGRAAVRFWDARAACGKMVELCRVLASDTGVVCASVPELRDEFARWIGVFPIAVKNFLRPAGPSHDRAAEIGTLLTAAETDELLNPDIYAPILVLNRMRQAAFRVSAEIHTDTAVRSLVYRELNEGINTLTGAFGACERINATPLPFVYVAHLRTFLLVYLGIWYMEALAAHGWPALPGLVLSSWALLGIEAAAIECERPFRRRSNHLPLGRFAVVTARNVAQTLKNTAHAPASHSQALRNVKV